MMKAYVIYGPPGTGKSTELLGRMRRYLKQGGHPARIGLISFTKVAAQELGRRANLQSPNICTLHSMAFRISGLIKDQVMNKSKLFEFSKLSGIEISGANPEEADYLSEGDEYLALYQLHHATLQKKYSKTYLKSERPGDMQKFLHFCTGLNDFKEANGYVDFNDMIRLALDKPTPELDVLFIDEAQDLSPLQWQLIYQWCKDISEVHVAGDDDQALYFWGGADPQGLVKFEKKFNAERKVLDQSYRVPSKVHSLAEKIINNVGQRVKKKYRPRAEMGQINHIADVNMINMEHGEDILVLFRNHSLRENIEARLIELGLPYLADSGRPGLLQSSLVRAIRTWNTLKQDWRIGRSSKIDLRNTNLNNLLRNVKPLVKQKLEAGLFQEIQHYDWSEVIHASNNLISYFQKIITRFEYLSVEPTIHLSTIHGAKGREADRVILFNGLSTRTYEAMLRDSDSEYRTFYVGVTRAKRQLDIVFGNNALSI